MEPTLKFPSIICVSELLRTWETAILLFLTKENTKLTLFISPFLREDGWLPADIPGILEDQLSEFMRFLVFLGQLQKFTKKATPDIKGLFSWIPNKFTITFKHYAGSFTDEIMRRIQKTQLFKLRTAEGALIIDCPDISSVTLDKLIPEDILTFLQQLYKEILDFNGLNEGEANADEANSGDGNYTEYKQGTATFIPPPPSKIPAFDKNLNKVSSPPSISTFAEWCRGNIEKIRDLSGIVYFVSHSHIMQAFVKKVIYLNVPPDSSFRKVFDVAKKTNSWSLFFNINGIKFKGFRHAFSCDNRYQAKGLYKFYRRWKAGSYTNLALWGILSTAIFAQRKIPGLIKDATPQSLKVSVGMKKETKDLVVDKYDKFNMLCGKEDDRFKTGNFEITLSNCGTSRKTSLTLHNDCIKIKCRQDNGTFYPKKVILELSDNTPPDIQVKFFDDDSNTYTPPPDKGPTTSLLKIASFLSGIPITIPTPSDDETSRYEELEGLTLEMTEAIFNFIESDVFKKTKHNAQWDKLFNPFKTEITVNVSMFDVEASGGGGRRLIGRRTKKMHKYKKYTKKYYTYQSRKQSRRHFQRRKRTHRRKSRRSRK